MLAMQYKIKLPADYDMTKIRERVEANGKKTDGFQGLNFKCYLVTYKGQSNNIQNGYCPLYLWDDTTGANTFILDGAYDNIIESFGWQRIETHIPLENRTTDNLTKMKYAIEYKATIQEVRTLRDLERNITKKASIRKIPEYLIMYNPTDWTYTIYYFTQSLLNEDLQNTTVYEILHVSK